MAGEYFRWKYRDVKPDEKPVYTKAELRRNWWAYHWKWLLLGLAFLVMLGFLIHDIFFRVKPDYTVAFVSRSALPDEVRSSLTARLSELGEDLNGDGKVTVELSQYQVSFDVNGFINTDQASTATTRLTVDLSSGDTYIILTDDPEGFQRRMAALAYLDGSTPDRLAEGSSCDRWREMVYPWADCPVLSGLDLGTYVKFLDISGAELDGQTAMEGIYVGRRMTVTDRDAQRFAGAEALWLKLTAGAKESD